MFKLYVNYQIKKMYYTKKKKTTAIPKVLDIPDLLDADKQTFHCHFLVQFI